MKRSALPDLDWEPTRGFWRAAQRRELAIPRCGDCGALVWYPKPACPRCDAAAPPWAPVSGRATLFSWTVVRRALFDAFADEVPYVTALVALAEDPAVRLVTTLVDCDADALRIDMPVRVTFRPLGSGGAGERILAPMFRPDPAP